MYGVAGAGVTRITSAEEGTDLRLKREPTCNGSLIWALSCDQIFIRQNAMYKHAVTPRCNLLGETLMFAMLAVQPSSAH